MIPYRELCQRTRDTSWVREKICADVKWKGIRAVARDYQIDPRTLRRWMKRPNLKRGPGPGTVESRISDERRAKIIEAYKATGWGPMRLKMEFQMLESASTIYRVLKAAGLIQPRKRRWKEKGDLRAFKAKYKPFEKFQVDAKTLIDIPAYWIPGKPLGLPRTQWTARCVKSGALFYAYSNGGETQEAACTFIVYLLEHLIRHGVKVKELAMKIQTDNGSFAVGHSHSTRKSAFRQLLELYGIKHRLIVPGEKTSQADVERSHGMIEQDFYRRQPPTDRTRFFFDASLYQIYFNYHHLNSYKGWKTPIQIVNEGLPAVDLQVLALPPIDLDKHSDIYYYKINPKYLPDIPELFFQDVPPPHYQELVREAYAQEARVGQETVKLDTLN